MTRSKTKPRPASKAADPRAPSKASDLSLTLDLSKAAPAVFAAVNDVAAWWNRGVEGTTRGLGAEFAVQFDDLHFSRQRIVDWVPDRRVTWLVTESRLSWLDDPAEWNGTRVDFQVTPRGQASELRFTHEGLLPDVECYQGCSAAWQHFVGGSLRDLIEKGRGQPHQDT
ncbi:MAG TPA: SRPBCC domain-containing protein [Candidatus Thermoplasmatota archaeon]|nr:SRPBCC domain-containing protein [Candidatus Thermoplasmatota archaeon]